MSKSLRKDPPTALQGGDARGTTEALAVSQTRRQILEILDVFQLKDLRTEFLTTTSENATSGEMAIAIANIKRTLLRSDLPQRDDIIERIETRTVLPSSRPPKASNI